MSRSWTVAIPWLLLGGCGALTGLNAGDAGTEGGQDGREGRDSGPVDAGTVSPHDAATPGDAMCPGAPRGDANGSPWSSYSLAKIDGGKDATLLRHLGERPRTTCGPSGRGAAPGGTLARSFTGTAALGSPLPPRRPRVSPASGEAGRPTFGPSVVTSCTGTAGAWSKVNPPDAGPLDLSAVWGSGASDVWAVGGSSRADNAWHWDGAGWSLSPNDELSNTRLSAVWGSGPTMSGPSGPGRSRTRLSRPTCIASRASCTGTAAHGRSPSP